MSVPPQRANESGVKAFTAQQRSDALPPPPTAAICKALGAEDIHVSWLAGDGSDRCYYRLHNPQTHSSFVLMQLSETDAKALKENGYDWIHVGKLLEKYNVCVPRLVVAMREYAALIIEDYGDVMFEGKILNFAKQNQWDKVQDGYRKTFGIVSQFLKIPQDKNHVWCQRAFDRDRFVWELNFFVKNYLEPVAGIYLSASELEAFQHESDALSTYLSSFSRWFVHRDFHSRNLMWKDGDLAVIDFQDARLGPSAYDTVSLCFDSYTPLPQAMRRDLLEEAISFIATHNGVEIADEIKAHWRPMLLQRQIKAIGSFGYLSIKKNRGNYLKYVAPAISTMIADVQDDRWPLLSGKLLELMQKKLP